MRRVNFYEGLALDRRVRQRGDRAWLAQRLQGSSARIIPVWRTKNLVAEDSIPGAAWLAPDEVIDHREELVFLGEDAKAAYFALDLSALDEAALGALVNGRGTFVDLRAVGPLMEHQQGALLAYARGLVHWHARHRFCGVCGSATHSQSAGHLRVCGNAKCGAQHFPRTDPAVIMLVTHGEMCFLGRQRVWPPGMHSTLAGFVEPGESLEDAVAREVFEEAGIRLREIRYHSSQPWPFPSSIMLGFTATAASPDYHVDPDELESGAWFERDFLKATHDPEAFRLPRLDSIARRLIEDWLGQG